MLKCYKKVILIFFLNQRSLVCAPFQASMNTEDITDCLRGGIECVRSPHPCGPCKTQHLTNEHLLY